MVDLETYDRTADGKRQLLCVCVVCCCFYLVLGSQEKRTTQHSKNLSVKKMEDYSARTQSSCIVCQCHSTLTLSQL